MFKIKTKYLAAVSLILLLVFALIHNTLGLIGSVILVLAAVFISTPIWSRHLITIRLLITDLFFNPIIINAIIKTQYGLIKHFNLGDDLNWFLIKKIQPRKISLLSGSVIGRIPFCKKENYLIIGSTVTLKANNKTVVWGAGAIDNKQPLRVVPQKVCAVRGPLTRQYFLENGVDCPAIYGDPAMLIKYVYRPQIQKKFKLGIIPHYVDFYSDKFKNLKKESDILFIKMQNYKSVENVINEITSCECILSSSLHGLIISESYNIPNIWIKVSDEIDGGSFKYLDYYESIGIQDIKPYLYTGTESIEELLELFKGYKKGTIDLRPLINAAPFELKIKI